MVKAVKTPSGKNSKHCYYNNDNIYKNDPNYYKMNKSAEFENSNEEENFKVEFFARFKELAKVILIIYGIFNILDIPSVFGFNFSLIFLLIRIALIVNSYFLIEDVSSLRENIKKIRILLEIEIISNLFETFSPLSTYSLYFFYSNQVLGMVLNYICGLSPNQSLYFYIVEGFIIISTGNIKNSNSFILFNFFKNLFSILGIKTILITSVYYFFEVVVMRNGREQWALLDSFKRSFFFYKNQSDATTFPTFLVSKTKIENILYKNAEADNFYKLIVSEKKKGNVLSKKSSMNLLKPSKLNNKSIW
jgi:hypothetical protein